jgi:phosphatidylinositol alpha-mannosyltransferase
MKSSTPKSLKIGLVFDDSLDSFDGVAQQVKIFGTWLSIQGHHVCYLVGETKMKEWRGDKVFSLAKNKRVSFNANRLSIPMPASQKDIAKIMAQEKFDVLHVQMPHSPFMAQKVVDAAEPTVAVIGTFHILPSGMLSLFGSWILKKWYGRKLKRFDKILSVSQPAADFAKTSYGIDSTILPNVVDARKIAHASKGTANLPDQIIFLGRLVKRKGAEEMIKAFVLIKDFRPAAKLIIAGEGPRRPAAVKLTKNLGVSDSVKFVGFVDEAEKPKLLATAQVACFPSLYGESFGVVLLEAIAAGSGVVVAGNNPGYASLLREHPEVLIEPRNSEQFARSLSMLLEDKGRFKRLHDWQQNMVKNYDVEVIGPELVKVYGEAIAKAKLRGHN